MVETMEMGSPLSHGLRCTTWQTRWWRRWRGCLTLVFPRREAEDHIVVMKKITGRSQVMRILVLAMDLIASVMAMEDMVVVAVLVLIISVEAVVHMDVVYDLKMKMRFMMSMRRDLMIMKILLVTMGVLDSHMNIVVVLVMMGKIIVVIAIEMIWIALLV